MCCSVDAVSICCNYSQVLQKVCLIIINTFKFLYKKVPSLLGLQHIRILRRLNFHEVSSQITIRQELKNNHDLQKFNFILIVTHFLLTGSPIVTTPMSLTTLGWWNCPLMAASCRNLTFSVSLASSFSIFTATSLDPPERSHTPFMTLPNWPEPSESESLGC